MVDEVEFRIKLINMDKIRVMGARVVVMDVVEFGMELANMDKIRDADMMWSKVVEVVEFEVELANRDWTSGVENLSK